MIDIDLNTIMVALSYIDAHDRDTWLKVGNALKTQFGSSGFDIWDNWSKTADNYDAKAVKSVWRSLTVGKVKIATMIYLAKQNGFDITKHEVKPIDPQEQIARQAKREQQAHEAETHEKAEKAAFEVLIKNIIRASNDAVSTPYTDSKGITTNGLLSINSKELHAFKHPFNQYGNKPESIGYALQGLITLVPFCGLKTGEFVKLQGISGVKATEGKDKGRYIKRWIGKGDGYYWCGDILNQGKPKVITEGMSDAQTIHEYTNDNLPSLASGNDGSLKKAALALRAECPHDPIIVFGDNDVHGGGQTKAQAAATAINGIFMLPPSKYKDVNEWVLAEGAEGLNKMIDETIHSKKAVSPSQDGTALIYEKSASESISQNLTHNELPDPIPLRKTLYPVKPFTQDLLPELLSNFVFDEADRMSAPPSFIAMPLIVSIGALIGAGCGIKPKQKDDWLVIPNLWGGNIANPTQKKTPSIDASMRILDAIIAQARNDYEAQLKQYEREKMLYDAELEGLQSDLKSSVKTTTKKQTTHTKEELIELICQKQESLPTPPTLRRYKTNDSTIERLGELERDNPNGILVIRDELIGLLSSLDKEGREGDRAFYLEGFNGTGSYDTDRIGRGNIHIPNHCLSIFGGIQPDKLMSYLEQTQNGFGNDGLLQRFQLLVYPDPITWQYRDRYPNREAFKSVLAIFSRLSESDFIEFGAYPIDDYNKRPYYRFTLDAQAFYVDWTYQLNAHKIPNEENSIIQQHLGKYDRLLPALALIFHLVDCVQNNTQGQVSLSAIKRAALWCEYLESHARRVYGLLLDGGIKSAIALSLKLSQILKNTSQPTAKTAETSDDWVNNGFVLRDIRRKQWQHLTDDTAIQKALVILEDNYWIWSQMQTSTEKGGRPTTRYFISEKLKNTPPPTAKTAETLKTDSFDSFGSTTSETFQNMKIDEAANFSSENNVNYAKDGWEITV